jgi:hemerythrin-like domain-containing protein
MPSKPDKDRDDPFAMLLRSHRRLEEELVALRDCACALSADPGDEMARDGIAQTRDFFARSVTRHEQDEERSLFPRIGELPALRAVVQELTAQHREHEALAARLDALVGAWRQRPPTAADGRDLERLAAEIAGHYGRHIAREERDLFPAAQEALPPEARRDIAREMQARRGR